MDNNTDNGENGENGYSRKKRKLSHNAKVVLNAIEESTLNRTQRQSIIDAIKASREMGLEDRKRLYGALAQIDREDLEEIIEILEDNGG